MKKRGVVSFSIILVFICILVFALFQTSIITYPVQATISEDHLENLRIKANVECLQNSQCSSGSECIENRCLETEEIDVCKEVSLSYRASSLKIGEPINNYKRVLSDPDLPHLLADGKIVEVIGEELIEHSYVQNIVISDSKIEKENEDYLIKPSQDSNELITYRLTFSKGVDFSSTNIRGQALRILDQEYVIGQDSTNSNIHLISDNKEIVIKDSLVDIIKDSDGNVIVLKIIFNTPEGRNDIKVTESYADPVFSAVGLSFNYANDDFADVRVGGSC